MSGEWGACHDPPSTRRLPKSGMASRKAVSTPRCRVMWALGHCGTHPAELHDGRVATHFDELDVPTVGHQEGTDASEN